jgi:site-specific DNA recombinase
LSKFDEKRKLQQMVFPDGILYNKKKDLVRTPGINSIFAQIPQLTGILKNNKKSRFNKSRMTSQEVVPKGIELISAFNKGCDGNVSEDIKRKRVSN